MEQTTTQRKTMAVQGYDFRHVAWLEPLRMVVTNETAPLRPLARAICTTSRPATRCECGMFNIEWRARDK